MISESGSTAAANQSSDDHPHRELVPLTRAGAHERRMSGATTQHFVDVGEVSRWFDTLVICDLPAGETDRPRVHPADSATETWYQLVSGSGVLVLPDRTEEPVRQFDAVFFSPGTGAELRTTSDEPLIWLIVSTAGGPPTHYSAAEGRGEGTLASLSGSAAPRLFRRSQIGPRQWPANTLGATAKPWWFYTVDTNSRWYHSNCVSCIAPGGSSTFHTHMERFEGPYETCYIALRGSALIRSEYGDTTFAERPSGVFVPSDASHQILNNGEEDLWYCTLSSRGDAPLVLDTYAVPSGADRPGYLEEFNRIMAARAARGLVVP